MGDVIREGGMGMLPVIVLAIASNVCALALAVRPSRPKLVLVAGGALSLLVSGLLGTVTGLRNADLAGVLDTSFGACLLPLQFALFGLGLAVPLGLVGAYRFALASGSR